MKTITESPRVPLKYPRIRFTTFQWLPRGLCINWYTLFTAQVMFGLVNVAYWRAPTTDLYEEGSENAVLAKSLNPQVMGVGIGFKESMQAL